jgi:hypothetical protein
MDRLEAWIKSGMRKSKAEIVQECLSRNAPKLDAEMDVWLELKSRNQDVQGIQTDD